MEVIECSLPARAAAAEAHKFRPPPQLSFSCFAELRCALTSNTDRYASPPDRELWGCVEQAKPGACGLYFFNQEKTTFLVGSRLCLAGAACTALDGEALGWSNAGDTVGEVGDPGDDEVEE